MKCVSYTRTVPWKNDAEQISIPEQNQRIADYIRNKPGWSLEKKYSDRKNDPAADKGFDQMVTDGTGRGYDCIIVASLYYCGTSFPVVRQMILDTLYAAGIHFVVVSESFDTTEKSRQEVLEYFEGKRREMHADICSTWRKSKGRSFVLTNSVPFGYIRPNGCDQLIKDTTVSGIVEEIFRMKLQGRKEAQIAAWLNEYHVETPHVHRKRIQGKPSADELWTLNAVRRLIHRPIYFGALTDAAGNIIIEHHHEPYLTEEEFYSIPGNNRSDVPKKKNRQNYKKPSPLAGILFCGHCGSPLKRRSNFETGETCFFCPRKDGHDGISLPLQVPMDGVFRETLRQMGEEKKLAEKADGYFRNREFREARFDRREELSKRMQAILAEMGIEQFRRVPLYEQYVSGQITESEYQTQCEAFRKACSKLDQRLAEVMKDAKNLEIAFSIKNPWILLYTQAEVPKELDKYTVRKLVERVEVFFPTAQDENMAVVFHPKLSGWKNMITELLDSDS